MKSTIVRGLAVSGSAILAAAMFSPFVSAQATSPATGTNHTYQVNLAQVNKSSASGTATVAFNGNNVTVSIRATGLSPNLAHPAHIHIGGQGSCPAPSADANKDGYVDNKEGAAAYGPISVSLTTTGDMSAASALAVDRMPKADAKGVLTYDRTFPLPSGVKASDLAAKASIVQHGISTLFNDKTKYDGDKKSELDSKLAFEATVPADCGQLVASPTGGASTGVGSISGVESPVLFVAGAAAILGAVAATVIARKQLTDKR